MTPAPVRIRCSAVRWSSTPAGDDSEMKVFQVEAARRRWRRALGRERWSLDDQQVNTGHNQYRCQPLGVCGLTRTAVVTPRPRGCDTAAGQGLAVPRAAPAAAGSPSTVRGRPLQLPRTEAILPRSGWRPISPSPLSTPSPPSRPGSIANSGDTRASVGCATTGISNR